MTLLGYRNPARRLSRAVRGLFRRPGEKLSDRKIFVVGRRGATRYKPENTITSFTRAIELGEDAIETDVCVTRDGSLRPLARLRVVARDSGGIESVIAWTISDEKRLRELVAIGVDGILTDDPTLLRGIVGARTKTV